jgi:hypothetical protein
MLPKMMELFMEPALMIKQVGIALQPIPMENWMYPTDAGYWLRDEKEETYQSIQTHLLGRMHVF